MVMLQKAQEGKRPGKMLLAGSEDAPELLLLSLIRF